LLVHRVIKLSQQDSLHSRDEPSRRTPDKVIFKESSTWCRAEAEPGYLGGRLLLAVNLGPSTLDKQIGVFAGMAVQINLLSAGLW
jgi:hypothetical protein